MGDFNAKNTLWGSSVTNKQGEKLHEIISENFFEAIENNNPTICSYSTNTHDTVDYIFASNEIIDHFDKITIDHNLASDHYMLHTVLNRSIPIINKKITVKLYNKVNWPETNDKLKEDLEKIGVELFEEIKKNTSEIESTLDLYTNKFTEKITEVIDQIPSKVLKGKNLELPSDIRDMIKERRNLRREYIRTRDPNTKSEINSLTKNIRKEITKYRKSKWDKKTSELKISLILLIGGKLMNALTLKKKK